MSIVAVVVFFFLAGPVLVYGDWGIIKGSAVGVAGSVLVYGDWGRGRGVIKGSAVGVAGSVLVYGDWGRGRGEGGH